MGLFSGVTKAVKSVANTAFNPKEWVDMGKKYFGGEDNSVGKLGLEALGTYFGYPGLGSAIGGFLGGDSSFGDILTTGAGLYSANQLQKQQEEKQQDQYNQFKADNMELAQYQNATAKQMAEQAQVWGRQNATEAQNWNFQNMEVANAYNQANAREQMRFQEYQANTQHSREVRDLKDAGLNPILSGTGGMGNAAPSGASSSVGTPSGPNSSAPQAQAANLTGIVTSAFSAMKAMADATNTQAQTQYIKGAQTAKTEADTQQSVTASVVNTTRARLNQDQSLKIASEIRNIMAVRENLAKTGELTDAQTAQVQQSTKNLEQVFRELKISGDIAESDVHFWTQLINKTSGSAAGLVDLVKVLRSVIKAK